MDNLIQWLGYNGRYLSRLSLGHMILLSLRWDGAGYGKRARVTVPAHYDNTWCIRISMDWYLKYAWRVQCFCSLAATKQLGEDNMIERDVGYAYTYVVPWLWRMLRLDLAHRRRRHDHHEAHRPSWQYLYECPSIHSRDSEKRVVGSGSRNIEITPNIFMMSLSDWWGRYPKCEWQQSTFESNEDKLFDVIEFDKE
jgi:hypothetical protein